MAYCTNCGTQMDGQFCPKCGAQAGAALPLGGPVAAGRVETGLGVNGASALCYLFGFVTGIVFLLLAPYNREAKVRFHAYQSIFLSASVAVLHIGISMMSLLLQVISFPLGVLFGLLHAAVSLGFFLVWLYMMLKSYQGEKVMLPVIGELAERQAVGGDSKPPAGTMGRAA
jgi:uncharacterized membrane protein